MLMRLLIDTLDAESEEGAEDAWRAEVILPQRRRRDPSASTGRAR